MSVQNVSKLCPRTVLWQVLCKKMNHRLHINQISTHLNMSPFLPPSLLFFDWLHPSDVQRHTGVAQGKSSGAVGNCVNCSILFLHKKVMNETMVYCISAKCLISKLKGPDLWWWGQHPCRGKACSVASTRLWMSTAFSWNRAELLENQISLLRETWRKVKGQTIWASSSKSVFLIVWKCLIRGRMEVKSGKLTGKQKKCHAQKLPSSDSKVKIIIDNIPDDIKAILCRSDCRSALSSSLQTKVRKPLC